MNDREREEWINNDEPLYLDWIRSRVGITTYVRRNRQMIDQYLKECHASIF